jgi:hypothetical protein
MCSIRLQKGEARWNMSNFCKGDKVRLNDKGLRVMPSPTFRTDAVAMLGILTVEDTVSAPTLEDPKSQALWFREMVFGCPAAGVDRAK